MKNSNEDNFAVALTKEICPVCAKQYNGSIIMTSLLTKSNADRVKELDGKAVGFMKEPCDECKEYMKQGVILIGVDETKTEDENNPYRTGTFTVVRDSAIKKMFDDKASENLIKTRVGFITLEVWDKLGFNKLYLQYENTKGKAGA